MMLVQGHGFCPEEGELWWVSVSSHQLSAHLDLLPVRDNPFSRSMRSNYQATYQTADPVRAVPVPHVPWVSSTSFPG